MGGGEGGVWRWGKREIIYLSLHCHYQQTWCLTSTETTRFIRDGEKGGGGEGGGKEVGEREIIYLSLHCHHQNDTCIKIGSDESHFNVS